MRRRLVAAAIVAAIAVSPVAAGMDRAMSAFKAGNFLEAAAEFQALVEASPRYDFGWFMLGYSLLRMRRPADAETMFRRAIEIVPDRAEYHHGLALALKDEGRFVLAIEVLNGAEPYAGEPRATFALHALRGYLHARIGRWQDAVSDLELTRRIKPDPASLEMLGQAYLGLGDLDRAAAVLDEALALEPGRPDTWRLSAETRLMQGQVASDPSRKKGLYAEALRRAERYAAMRPDATGALNLVGRAALGVGRLDDAERAFERVLENDPRQCYVMVNLARARVARAAWDAAEQMLHRAAACAPRLGVVHETLGAVYLRQGRWAEAAAAFQRAERVQPSPYARAGLAEARRRIDGGVRSVDGPPPGEN